MIKIPLEYVSRLMTIEQIDLLDTVDPVVFEEWLESKNISFISKV